MIEHLSFTRMMVELLSWPRPLDYRCRELAGRIITYDVRITWWFSAVGTKSPSHSEEDLLDLLEVLLEQHERLETAWEAFTTDAFSRDRLVAVMRSVTDVVQRHVDELPDQPWA